MVSIPLPRRFSRCIGAQCSARGVWAARPPSGSLASSSSLAGVRKRAWGIMPIALRLAGDVQLHGRGQGQWLTGWESPGFRQRARVDLDSDVTEMHWYTQHWCSAIQGRPGWLDTSSTRLSSFLWTPLPRLPRRAPGAGASLSTLGLGTGRDVVGFAAARGVPWTD